jgi:hypothetical protein
MTNKQFVEWLKDYINDDEATITFKRWNIGSFDFKEYLLKKINEIKEEEKEK